MRSICFKNMLCERCGNVFVVLNITRYDKKFRIRKRRIRKINRTPPLTCHTSRGLPFYLLNVHEEKQGIDWKSAAERCGRYASRIIAPRNITLPDNGIIKRFIPTCFISTLTFNTAVALLKDAGIDPKSFSITLTDRNGNLASSVCRLLPFSSTVRIITSRPERYAAACTEALDGYGATLIIRSSYERRKNPDFIINCDSTVSPAMSESAIITSKRSCGGFIRFDCSALELTEAHKNLILPDIEPMDFAGALTELCACSDYSGAVFSCIEPSCRKCSAESTECLRCYVERACRPSAFIRNT